MRWTPRWRPAPCWRDRAAIHRHRRRLLLPVRAGGRRKVIALNGSGRAPGAATIDWYRERRHHGVREHLGPRGDRPGRAVRLGDAAEGARPQGPRRTAAARDPLCRATAGRCTELAWDWKRQEEKLRKSGKQALPARRHGAGTATSSCSRRWPRRCGIAARGANAFYGARSPPTWSRRCGRAAACTPRRTSPTAPRRRIRRADQRALEGARRLAVPAQRTGHSRADDPRHSGRSVPLPDGPDGADAISPAYRGRAARLPGPRRLSRRPAECETPVGRLMRRTIWPNSPGSSMMSAPCPICRRRARARWRRIAIPSRLRSSTATETPAVSSTRSSALRRRHCRGTLRRHHAESRLGLPPGARSSELHSRRTRGRRTPSCPAWRRGMAGPRCGSGSWAGITSRWASPGS